MIENFRYFRYITQPLCQTKMYRSKKNLVVIGSLVLMISACVGDGLKRKIEKVEAEVITLHDEVMPLMDPLYKIRKQLQQKAETDTSDVQLVEAILNIKSAEEEMMNWMRIYDPNFRGKDDTETLDYLSKQKKSIEQVGINMNEALARGEDLIKLKRELSTD